MNIIIVQMNWLFKQLSFKEGKYLLVGFVILLGCSEKPNTEDVFITVDQKIISEFNSVKEKLDGFCIMNFDKMKTDDSFFQTQKLFNDKVTPVLSRKFEWVVSVFNDMDIDIYKDVHSITSAFYNTDLTSDFVSIINADFISENIKKRMKEMGYNSVYKSENYLWNYQINEKIYVRINKNNQLVITSKPEYYVGSSAGQDVVSQLLDNYLIELTNKSQIIYYFKIPTYLANNFEESFSNDEKNGDVKIAVTSELEKPIDMFGILFFDKGIKSKNRIRFNSDKNLTKISLSINTIIGFSALRSHFSNNVAWQDYLDISHRDSLLYITYDLPDNKLKRLMKD